MSRLSACWCYLAYAAKDDWHRAEAEPSYAIEPRWRLAELEG